MRDENMIVRQRQLTIRREMDRRGMSLKALSFDTGLPYSTLISYFPGEKDREPAGLPVAALNRLVDHVPPDLLSLLLPDGWQIVRAPETVDHDELAEAMHDYLATKEKAHRPDSPGGREIAPCEDGSLRGKITSLQAKAA